MMPFSPTGDPDADRVLAGLQEHMSRAEEVGQRLAELRGRGEAADGHVRVEVGATGALADLYIDPRAMRLGSAALAEAIMEAVGRATTAATETADELMASLLAPFELSET
ncbi:YbaB/EbfC family nucleoid-associated protein [Microtetraspora niveoalba]|uniref:YbaB/EbfC family nucleoid-associated protein n=1 Tax=Microtetraspora niveoalba TaxID=46175 RepID=UPI00082CF7AA|nr:YbaB/EbfC family nucleoid-associated protein [Microtetraspora niveoalba]